MEVMMQRQACNQRANLWRDVCVPEAGKRLPYAILNGSIPNAQMTSYNLKIQVKMKVEIYDTGWINI